MNIVFFTGAGVSAESGIPTFRDVKGDAKSDFETLLSVRYFNKHPEKTWAWLNSFIDQTSEAKPNKAHILIAESGADVITQNIDCFHQMAGSENVLELHGTTGKCVCMKCKEEQELKTFCEKCGAYTKPSFVFYDEQLDQEVFSKAEQLAIDADIFIIVGTTGQVQPANEIPFLAKKHGATIVDINPGITEYDGIADTSIKLPASDGIEQILGNIQNGY